MTFNRKAAAEAYDLIMKMDEDEARAFTTMVTVDVMHETIDKNLPMLQRHLDKVIAKRVKTAKEVLAKQYAKTGSTPELEEAAKTLLEISKANAYDFGYHFNERDVRRNAKGQFSTKINPTKRRKPIRAQGIPASHKPGVKSAQRLDNAQKARFQNEWQQVSSFLSAAQNSGIDLSDEHTVRMQVQNLKTDEVYTLPLKTQGGRPVPSNDAWDPKTEKVIAISARPNELTAGGAAFNLVSALGAPGAAANIGEGVKNGSTRVKGGGFANDWYGGYDEMNPNTAVFSRLTAGGSFVNNVAPAGSKTQMAGAFAEFVGSHGPEAEKVFGPPTRKAGYRYRGTERKMDEEEISEKTNLFVRSGGPASAKYDRYRKYLQSNLPKKELTSLNLAAGNTPPSEGIIIDKDGNAVTQAIGYGDDHYLPFNLKNLKGLKGGEYIRTRSTGGPTSEDIYTGLMSGANRLTVVSRSGTFVVQFRDDFRGGRRYNQKAARMVGRYQRLLDAVRSRQVERKPMDPVRRRAIETEIRDRYGNLDERELRPMIEERIAEEANNSKLSDDSQTEYDKWAEDFDRINMDRKAGWRAHQKANKYNAMLEEQQSNFKLNGRGYEGALHALKEQFPYYIAQARYIPPSEDADFYDPRTDKGYVRPGALAPVAARANYFGGTSPESNQAFASAEKKHYGNLNLKFRQSAAAAAATGDGGDDDDENKPKASSRRIESPDKMRDKIAEARQEHQASKDFAKELGGLRDEILGEEGENPLIDPKTEDAAAPWLNMTDEEIGKWAKKGNNRQKAIDYLSGKKVQDHLTKNGVEIRRKLTKLRDAGGKFGGEWNKEQLLMATDDPMTFQGPMYKPGETAKYYDEEMKKMSGGRKPLIEAASGAKALHDMDATDLRRELETALQYRELVEGAVESFPEDQRRMADYMNSDGDNLTRFPVIAESLHDSSTKPIDEYIGRLHKMRAIRKASDSPAGGAVPGKEEELGKRLATTFQEVPGLLEMLS